MINAFPKSRCVAWTGGAVLGAAAGISAWLYMAGRAASLFNRAIVALLAAFIAVNIALYIARLMAAREYQKRLLLLYEALDPSAFLQARAAAHCSRQELQKGIRTKGAPYAGLSAALHGYCPGKARRCGSASKGF